MEAAASAWRLVKLTAARTPAWHLHGTLSSAKARFDHSFLPLQGLAALAARSRCYSSDAVNQTSWQGGLLQPRLAFKAPQEDSGRRRAKRTGVLGIKCGMMVEWDKWGKMFPLTVIWMDDNVVVANRTEDKEGYTAVQVGMGTRKMKNVRWSELGHFLAAGVPVKRYLREFRVSPDALLPAGTPLFARHFVPGQFVDVRGTSKGKGFAGVMKRWGFGGGPASHGNSLTHRAAGATGSRQDPGRVFKGTKMAGHMGHAPRVVQNLQVYKVDPARNLVYVRGPVPGPNGSMVQVYDAVRKYQWSLDKALPYPTFVADPGAPAQELEKELVAPDGPDPYAAMYHFKSGGAQAAAASTAAKAK
eukprot:jgi/Mesvir1/25707/Mv01901-RA.1